MNLHRMARIAALLSALIGSSAVAQEYGPGYALGLRIVTRGGMDATAPGDKTVGVKAGDTHGGSQRVLMHTHTFTFYDTTGEMFAAMATASRAAGANLAAQQRAEADLRNNPGKMVGHGEASYTAASPISGEMDRFVIRMGFNLGTGSVTPVGGSASQDLPGAQKKMLGFELRKGFANWDLDDAGRFNLAIWAGGTVDIYTEHNLLETIDVLDHLAGTLKWIDRTSTSGDFQFYRIALPAGVTFTAHPMPKLAIQAELGVDILTSLLRKFVSKNQATKDHPWELPILEARGIYSVTDSFFAHGGINVARFVAQDDNDEYTRYGLMVEPQVGVGYLF